MTSNYRLYFLLLSIMACPAAAEETAVPEREGKVGRAQFTTAIEDREPVDKIVVLSPPADEIFFFTDLRNLEGHTVVHRWRYRGDVVSQVPFEVGGPRWRVFSKKVLDAGAYGEWSVTVVDEGGWPLYMELFRYEPARERASGAALGMQSPE